MKNILITGGAGFIGSNLTKELVSRGYTITILDNLSKQVHGNNQNSDLYNSIKEISNFILGDVCNKSDWNKALKGQDAVIHLAAETGTGQSMYEITRYNHVNIVGTSHMLNILANDTHTIKKIIIASSRAIYGEGRYYCEKEGFVFPKSRSKEDLSNSVFDIFSSVTKNKLELTSTDELSNIDPISIYGITKQNQEQMSMLTGKVLNIPTVSLRYQNVYGPGQSLSNPYTGILSIFSTRLLNNNHIEIYEDGKQSRDFVYIDDVVKATVLSLESDAANHQIFNVGSGEPTSVIAVANILHELYESRSTITITNKYRTGDIRHNYADLKKITSLINYNPTIDFLTGVKKFVDWVKQQEVNPDSYESSINKLAQKGFFK